MFIYNNIVFNKDLKILALLATGLVLAGCAGRSAHPIAATNPADSSFDCAGISREFVGNERQIQSTLQEKSQAQGKNVVVGAAGLLFLPFWFFLDPKSPEKREIDALRNRNKVLEDISAAKKCGPVRSQMGDIYQKLDHPHRK